MSELKIKPCPFCGGEMKFHRDSLVNKYGQTVVYKYYQHADTEQVRNQPTANIQEVKHGQWISTGSALGYIEYHCSECNNYLFLDSKSNDLYDYCPYCGAKMDKECEK